MAKVKKNKMKTHKGMKKVFKVIFVICFTFISIVPMGTPVSAKTLKQYKNEVAALEAKAKENKRVTANAKASINSKRNAIITANNTIEENEKKVENAKIKVAESEEQIKIKTSDILINLLIRFKRKNPFKTNN